MFKIDDIIDTDCIVSNVIDFIRFLKIFNGYHGVYITHDDWIHNGNGLWLMFLVHHFIEGD